MHKNTGTMSKPQKEKKKEKLEQLIINDLYRNVKTSL